MKAARSVLGAAVILLAAAGCPKSPPAVITAISSADDLRAVKDAFNADAEHRRMLVLLSPT